MTSDETSSFVSGGFSTTTSTTTTATGTTTTTTAAQNVGPQGVFPRPSAAGFGRDRIVYDGRRMRKPVVRKSIDFNGTISRYLMNRCYREPACNRSLLFPTMDYMRFLEPSPTYHGNPSNSFTTKYVHMASNKIRRPINCVTWTPDGRRCLTGSHSGEFTMWNGLQFNFETILQAHNDPIRSMVWSHNGKWLVSTDDRGMIKYWQSSMNNVKAFQGHSQSSRDLSFSPSDMLFATASDDCTCKIWDFRECKEVSALTGHHWDVNSVSWHPRKALIATGSKDNFVKLWCPKSGRNVATMCGHKNSIRKVSWNRNGHWLITGGRDQLIKLWDVRTMRETQSFKGHLREVTTLAWHPWHETMFCSASADGSVHFWVTGQEESQAEICGAHDSSIGGMAWHPLGHMLVTGSNDQATRFWTRNRPGDEMDDKYNANQLPDAKRNEAIRDLAENARLNPARFGRLPAVLERHGGELEVESEATPAAAASKVIPGLGSGSTIAATLAVQDRVAQRFAKSPLSTQSQAVKRPRCDAGPPPNLQHRGLPRGVPTPIIQNSPLSAPFNPQQPQSQQQQQQQQEPRSNQHLQQPNQQQQQQQTLYPPPPTQQHYGPPIPNRTQHIPPSYNHHQPQPQPQPHHQPHRHHHHQQDRQRCAPQPLRQPPPPPPPHMTHSHTHASSPHRDSVSMISTLRRSPAPTLSHSMMPPLPPSTLTLPDQHTTPYSPSFTTRFPTPRLPPSASNDFTSRIASASFGTRPIPPTLYAPHTQRGPPPPPPPPVAQRHFQSVSVHHSTANAHPPLPPSRCDGGRQRLLNNGSHSAHFEQRAPMRSFNRAPPPPLAMSGRDTSNSSSSSGERDGDNVRYNDTMHGDDMHGDFRRRPPREHEATRGFAGNVMRHYEPPVSANNAPSSRQDERRFDRSGMPSHAEPPRQYFDERFDGRGRPEPLRNVMLPPMRAQRMSRLEYERVRPPMRRMARDAARYDDDARRR